jgi:hypothetical protein
LGQETQAMDIRPVEICPFDSNSHVFLRRVVGERMISACVDPTVKQWRWCGSALLVTLSVIYLEFKATLNQHGYQCVLVRRPLCAAHSTIISNVHNISKSTW